VPELTTEQTSLALAIIAGVALLAFLVTLIVGFRLRKVRREYRVLLGESGQQDLVTAAGRAVQQMDGLSKRLDELYSRHENAHTGSRRALQRFGIVRYDAFEEMGGRISFSLALLDDHGDGVVLTSINGRTEARTYVKPIVGLNSEHNLSDEEREAMAAAMANHGRSQGATPISQAR
jgi:hypothetical protein